MKNKLDNIDWKILKELQKNGRITNIALAQHIGISAPPCLRRVRVLEESGIIRGYSTILDEKILGYNVMAFVMVGLINQNEENLNAFEGKVKTWPIVRECFMLSGEIDFILKCVAPDLCSFQTFITEELMKAPMIANIKTTLTLHQLKDECSVSLL